MAKNKKRKQYIHPWDKWFSSRYTILVCGEDFTCEPWSLATQIRNKASKAGIKVSISLKRNLVLLTVLNPKEIS